MSRKETYPIDSDSSQADRIGKSLLRTLVIRGPVLAPILLFMAACGGESASPTPTATEIKITPSPTPDVATYSLEAEEDTDGDGRISTRDLMDQRKGKECRECENFDFDLVISQNDVDVARSKITPGVYNRRIDINNDGRNTEEDFTQIADDIGKPVPTGGEFRADSLEGGWYADQVMVHFKLGTEAESALSALKIKSNTALTNQEFEEAEAKIRKKSLEILGLNEEWGIGDSVDLRNGFMVVLVVPEEVLQTMTLGEVIELRKQNANVSKASRNYLLSLL